MALVLAVTVTLVLLLGCVTVVGVFNAALTVQYDRVTVMQGAVHASIFAAFLFFAFVP